MGYFGTTVLNFGTISAQQLCRFNCLLLFVFRTIFEFRQFRHSFRKDENSNANRDSVYNHTYEKFFSDAVLKAVEQL